MARSRASRPLVALELALGTCLLLLGGCASVGPLSEVDLQAPEWSVRTGQAVWKRNRDSPPLAGELIVASHRDGDVLVSFSKPPVPIFTAQTEGDAWRIDLAVGGRSFSGRGRPPRRFVWFELPRILDGDPAPKRWLVEHPEDDRWLLTNARRDETIRVVLDPGSP